MNLLENGFDSLKKCIIGLKQAATMLETNPDYEFLLKDITINLHHSTETLFKALVMKYNPYLIYADVNKYLKQEVENLWSVSKRNSCESTIQFLDAIHCVIVAYSLSIDKETYNRLKRLNDTRNDLTHYTFTFPPKEMENRIALLLPELFRIYAKCIPEFEPFAKANHIYTDTEVLTEAAEILNLNLALNLKRRWLKAKTICNYLMAHPDKIQAIFNKKKENEKYIKCPCCEKSLLFITSNYIASVTDVRLLGACEYCSLEINQNDGKFFCSILEIDEEITEETLNNCILKNLSSVITITRSNMQKDIQSILDEYRTEIVPLINTGINSLAEAMKISYQYLVDDMCVYMAKSYFEDNIYYNNDVVEQDSIDDDFTIEIAFSDLENYLEINEYNENIYEPFITVSNRIKDLNNNLFEIMISFVSGEYLSYHAAMYLDYDGEENDVEYTIEIKIDKCDIETIKKLLV
ncbi:hypothetical protein DFR58_1414 [Anaerobacterium chartisolvens]|uniref:Uncharacterized protein n=1 Tax=Anaerobacterium chartisolvens TaxID=1297424 RepID=A0A369AHM0_9FIRM|nr:hypothetical protein [Anaerobacterium chartisolvens]RCX08661.1 hypothetical protein DFR58_1414 [Anaerobacterium chartisolvens]